MTYSTDRKTLEEECQVDFYTASGPGGQHRNRSRTAVRLRHEPSGLVITATERRSQKRNLDEAYNRLIEALKELNHKPKPRRPTKPSKAVAKNRLRDKAARSQIKKSRQRPKTDDEY
mgnify:CR=1 FL=1